MDVTGPGTWAADVIAPSAKQWHGCGRGLLGLHDHAGKHLRHNRVRHQSNSAGGITWAAEHGAKNANLEYAATDSSTVGLAAQYLLNQGGITISPADNNATFDSSLDSPYTLTVSGSIITIRT